MTRLIDADKLRAEYQAILDRGDMFCEYDIIGMVDNAPTVEERPHGEWKETGHINLRQCSNCDSQWGIYSIEDFDFCPSCGAKMREADND